MATEQWAGSQSTTVLMIAKISTGILICNLQLLEMFVNEEQIWCVVWLGCVHDMYDQIAKVTLETRTLKHNGVNSGSLTVIYPVGIPRLCDLHLGTDSLQIRPKYSTVS